MYRCRQFWVWEASIEISKPTTSPQITVKMKANLMVHKTGQLANKDDRYSPAVLDEFEKTGILQEVVAAGDKNTDGCTWRDGSGKVLADIDPPRDKPHFGICLGQHDFCDIAYKKLVETGNGQVLFNTAYLHHEQKDDCVHYWIKDSSRAAEIAGECRYLIGTDGGRSTVRKSLGIKFKGFTWESVQFIAANFRYPLDSLGWKKTNYVIDPLSWGTVGAQKFRQFPAPAPHPSTPPNSFNNFNTFYL
ncbi:uncharacterized protein FRV6_11570 [Fusarium oxysporum]|uniref:FAD-binding domain-containing protein n=1 Tax=Fusarium oxysporum TaxID=5507 RepID=A0A2H3TFG3_FUSOX|nr:uncharacterized protein FRV6_11570 [Fusarium oxysporum]